jgi:hypothetical protein
MLLKAIQRRKTESNRPTVSYLIYTYCNFEIVINPVTNWYKNSYEILIK